MKNLEEHMAEKFYNIHQRIVFTRHTFSTTSLVPPLWKDLKERDRKEHIEAFRQVLADKEISDIIASRADL